MTYQTVAKRLYGTVKTNLQLVFYYCFLYRLRNVQFSINRVRKKRVSAMTYMTKQRELMTVH